METLSFLAKYFRTCPFEFSFLISCAWQNDLLAVAIVGLSASVKTQGTIFKTSFKFLVEWKVLWFFLSLMFKNDCMSCIELALIFIYQRWCAFGNFIPLIIIFIRIFLLLYLCRRFTSYSCLKFWCWLEAKNLWNKEDAKRSRTNFDNIW